jgi:phage major head subunit gpT-like protein
MSLDTAKATVVLRDLTQKFDNTFQQQQPFYPKVCTVVNSNGSDEKYGWLGSVPSVREWLGDRNFNELRASTFALPNKQWEDSLQIAKTDLADDRMGMYSMAMPELAKRAALHPDKLLFQSIVAGESTACSDGQYFYDTDHAFGESGSQSNDLTYNATDHTAVTVAEFKAAFDAAVIAILNFKDDNGEPFAQPTVSKLADLQVIVPTALRKVAYESVESVMISNSSNVVIDRPEIICSPFLTTGTKFYVNYLGSFLKPFVFQAREPLKRQMKGLEDNESKFVKFMTDARYNIGYLAWWNSVLTTFN